MKSRAGAALIELMTSAVLLGMVSAACAALLRADALIVLHMQQRTVTEEAMRIASSVVRSEVNSATDTDVRLVARDSLALRAFRGYGIVCGFAGTRTVLRYRGLRAPDADKDSLLITGEEVTTDFRGAAVPRGICAAGSQEEIVALTPTASLQLGTIVLFFETGAYHLSTNALRYRRGGEGKQPLTDEVLDDRVSSFFRAARTVTLKLRSSADSSDETIRMRNAR